MGHLKIQTKMMLIYGVILIICAFVSYFSFVKISGYIVEKEVEKMSVRTLATIDRNLEEIINHLEEVSDIFFFEEEMQGVLTSIDSEDIDSKIQAYILKRLTNMSLSVNFISSVFIVDNYENVYYSSYRGDQFKTDEIGIKKARWYERVNKYSGDLVIVPNAGGYLINKSSNEKYLSIIKNIVNLTNYEKIGTLIININEGLIQSYFKDLTTEQSGDFFIVDGNNQFIINPTNEKLITAHITNHVNLLSDESLIKLEGKTYLKSSLPSKIEDFKIYSIIPMEFGLSSFYGGASFLVAISILCFVLLCTILLSRLIFIPLHELQQYMKRVEKGEFIEIPIDTESENEIINLKKGFNKMVDSIQELIGTIEREQKMLRKAELDVIQSQINPHFLYNTLDAINVLTLIGDNENANKMIASLGGFYRNSLNSGRDLVTVKEEIECIENYMTILNIRYDNKVSLIFDIEEEILSYKILKLILQPLVENSVYHGIRQKHGKGKIKIEGYRDESELIFIITDNGVGISSERIEHILQNKIKAEQGGFGVYSCMQRIAIFYGIKQPMTIVSEVNIGTEITLRLKVLEEFHE